MKIREGNIRENYELDLQKTQASVKLCLKWHKSVSKLWRKKSGEFDIYLQGLRRKPRRSYNKRNQTLGLRGEPQVSVRGLLE